MQRLDVITLEQRFGQEFPVGLIEGVALMNERLGGFEKIQRGIKRFELGSSFLLYINQPAQFNREEFL